MMAALAATAISLGSCSKTTGGPELDPDYEGGTATMGLTISFPKIQGTRADDGNAEAKDVAVNKINVFIFKTDGTPAKGNNTINVGMFAPPVNNVWTLAGTNRVVSSAGQKRIYVGANLPAALESAAMVSESALLNEAMTTDLAGTAIAMLGYADKKLESSEVNSNQTVNDLSVEINRLVAKVTATMGTASKELSSTTNTGWSVTIDNFTVGGTAQKFYPRQRTNGLTGDAMRLTTPGDRNQGPKAVNAIDLTANAPVAVNDMGTAAKVAKSFYVPEHATSANYYRQEATYAVIRGELKFNDFTTVSNNAVGSASAAGDTTSPIFVVRNAGKSYFFADAANRDAFIALNGLSANFDTFQRASADQKLYAFYYVFLNTSKADKLSVYRNQFINIQIDGVSGVGTPGQDGAPENPNLTPNDPTGPATEIDAQLNVTVDVKPWDYYTVPTILN